MRFAADTDQHENDPLYKKAESSANIMNLKFMAAMSLFMILAEILNEFGLFKVPRYIMLPVTVTTVLIFCIPVGVYFFGGVLRGRGAAVLQDGRLKYVILTASYVGIMLVCVSLSMHVVALLVVPSLQAAQYRYRKRIFFWTAVFTVALVFVSVYGAFIFGATDRNFIKGMLSDEEAGMVDKRLSLLTPNRLLELFLHYVLPRMFCVMTVSLLAFGVARRNAQMLEAQSELDKKVKEEMTRRDRIQSRVIDALATLIENRDEGTGDHVRRTKRYVSMIAHAMKNRPEYRDTLIGEEIDRIINAAPLHDVGKIAVSDTILLKPGKLTPEEFEKMKVHTVKGKSMMQNIFAGLEDGEFLKTAEQIAVAHHEKWDGSGYPYGLSGSEIPVAARIMAVADVFDALVSVRVYKPAVPPEKAMKIIYSESGTHFDPGIIEVVRSISKELIEYAMSPAE